LQLPASPSATAPAIAATTYTAASSAATTAAKEEEKVCSKYISK